jgi:hypothetical protein
LAEENVTPIRPGVPVKSKSKRPSRDDRIKDNLHDFQFRIGRASALARALALALDGKVLEFEIEATEGCLGVAELLDGIRDDMYNLSQTKSDAGVRP